MTTYVGLAIADGMFPADCMHGSAKKLDCRTGKSHRDQRDFML